MSLNTRISAHARDNGSAVMRLDFDLLGGIARRFITCEQSEDLERAQVFA
jgi:hypothetical protein